MSSINNQRRLLLRGAVALCGTLCLPAMAKSNRGFSGPAASTKDQELAAGPKVSKAQVKYQEQPKGNQMCATCQQFISPNSCKLVEGKISPNGWCVLWARKAS
jgi:hypothetical protein